MKSYPMAKGMPSFYQAFPGPKGQKNVTVLETVQTHPANQCKTKTIPKQGKPTRSHKSNKNVTVHIGDKETPPKGYSRSILKQKETKSMKTSLENTKIEKKWIESKLIS